ncbi:MAG: 1-acyl-sn-glycerol-3-phosphate acyltransferase [Flavobacteriales bacterium]
MTEARIDVNQFDDIRPYNDAELREAIKRLVQEPLLIRAMRWVYPGLSKASIVKMFESVQTVQQFQEEIGAPAMKVITQMTTSGLSFSNIENIQRNTPYLFISNHRDIILDSALLNVSLMERGYKTTEIAIGDNLLSTPLVRDLVRSNKNVIVNRDVNAKEIYHYSLRLSNYIKHLITEKKTSLWIAQREGRSKDGDDRTSTGLLKMFAMSATQTLESALHELHIVPMCVSYEYDPCDLLKTHELMHKRISGSYTKQKGEDFLSMLTGLTGHKGRVNIAVGRELTDALDAMRNVQNKNEKFRMLGEAIDREMYRIYKLWPTNYIACDLLHGTKEYREHYTNIQRIAFLNYVRGRVISLSLGRSKTKLPKENFAKTAREIMLEMYANPVLNKKNITQSIVTDTLAHP